jgi:hypothetical protein
MYRWYRLSTICYALLSDIRRIDLDTTLSDIYDSDSDLDGDVHFKESRWFTRGWTLQELLAPCHIEFYAADWSRLGTKTQLLKHISKTTGINPKALEGEPLSRFCAAEKMSWAAQRSTTRIEDGAYCLLGLFDVSMPLLYGEGERAFLRLQEHIIQEVEDYTLFAWPGPSLHATIGAFAFPVESNAAYTTTTSILALSPREFRHLTFEEWRYSDLVGIERAKMDAVVLPPQHHRAEVYNKIPDGTDPPSVTARGIRLSLPLAHLSGRKHLACLWTTLRHSSLQWLCIALIQSDDQADKFARDAIDEVHLISASAGLKFTRCQIYIERLSLDRVRTKRNDNSKSDLMKHMLALPTMGEHVTGEEASRAIYSACTTAVALSTRFFGGGSQNTMHVMLEYIKISMEKKCVTSARQISLDLIENIASTLNREHSSILLACQAATLFKGEHGDIVEQLFATMLTMFEKCHEHGDHNLCVSDSFLVRVMQAQDSLKWQPKAVDIHNAEAVLLNLESMLPDRPTLDAAPFRHTQWLEESARLCLARYRGNVADVSNLLESLLYLLAKLRHNTSPLAVHIMLLLLYVLEHDRNGARLEIYQRSLPERFGKGQQIDRRWTYIIAAVQLHLKTDGLRLWPQDEETIADGGPDRLF